MEEIGRSTGYKDDDFPFLRYATTSWVGHTKQCDARSVPQQDPLALFAWPSDTFVESWVRVYRIMDPYSDACPPKGTSLVHVVSRYGVFGLLTAILQRIGQITIDTDNKDETGRTPLSWAAAGGHEAIVKLLLDTGKVDVDTRDNAGWTPLVVLCTAGISVLYLYGFAPREATNGQNPTLAVRAIVGLNWSLSADPRAS